MGHYCINKWPNNAVLGSPLFLCFFAGKEQAVEVGYGFPRLFHLEEYDLKYIYFHLPERE